MAFEGNSKRKREPDGINGLANGDGLKGPRLAASKDARPPSAAETNQNLDLALLEALESSEVVEVIDVRGLKKIVLGFERKLRDNLEARMKYMDQPDKFVESEVDLDEEIKKMHSLAAAPDLYPELVRLNAVSSILGLLSHENTDIAIGVVDLLNDLTDEDVIGESDEPALILVDALIENNALELLIQNLARLDEADSDEGTAVFNTLSIVENMIEVKPQVAELVCERTKLLRWLLTRLKVREFDVNKLYASEILAILLQNSTINQRRLGQLNGVDTILQAVAMYKSRDPKTTDEEEMLENLFDCLCSVVMPTENKDRFVKAEGVELMIIIMKQKRLAYASAMKALDFAMTRCTAACERFVDVQGLKTLFAAFMGKVPTKTKKKGDRNPEEIEERVISLISSLFGGLTRGSRKERLLEKFKENEYEKIDRLMELYIRYSDRVKAESKRLDAQELEDVELDDEERYLKKLEAGLYTLQLLALILGNLWATGHGGMQDRIELLLKQQRLSRDDVKAVLKEYVDNIGDLDGPEEKERRCSKIQKIISAM
ncbi:beta-catenin-like protein 1 [Marchantia polymorpha subsp. ruderalis]|uniref:Beta-catenin-like protein 1 N-terminal domain-containing protein n=2 Tax=Marchantia polymorpha TaxID=3197 RepID=A0A176W914_MARPO|nr:hypothetical protein AXG93_2255s1250 [Marchantia polymorpha subsp. ruderalis]PTQ31694.1 hypothetical protein MARPO_0108s0041 [Marchantia polymorpha]BBN19842.1 hypothetical protein Mp_8g14140 [Marchantia polymorpha subsp. ruderalis]|eukprot:PTQ31694.1 hypothetical protein MARPO_0108s0041 [Marchantia polymorpha]